MNLCTCDIEECECEVGAGVNDTMFFETLQVVGLSEAVRTAIRLRKTPINLCVYDSEDRECGLGANVNDTILLLTGADLLDGDTGTHVGLIQHLVYYETIK
jgi:hypothetical protein